MRFFMFLFAALALSACTATSVPAPKGAAETRRVTAPLGDVRLTARQASDNFLAVVDLVEPVAERMCRKQTTGVRCDYQVVVDSRTDQPANAFQTLDPSGRPIIAFTIALIADARNRDELAFIFGHEAAHHIAGHIPKQQSSAVRGALLAGALASAGGAEAATIRAAQDIGASVGARVFSKEFELEADSLGAVIAFRAGYDPILGARYFERIQDPGNRFLGTHPPNAERIRVVRQTTERLRAEG